MSETAPKFINTDWTKVTAGKPFKVQWDKIRKGVYIYFHKENTTLPARIASGVEGSEWSWYVPKDILDFLFYLTIGDHTLKDEGSSPLFRIVGAQPLKKGPLLVSGARSMPTSTTNIPSGIGSQIRTVFNPPKPTMASLPNKFSTFATTTSTSAMSSTGSAITLPSEMGLVQEHSLSPAAKGGIFAGTFCGFVLIGLAFWFGQHYAKRNKNWPAPIGIGEAEPVEKLTEVGLKRLDTVTQMIGSNGRIVQSVIAGMDGGTCSERIELESRAVSFCDKGNLGEDLVEETIQDKYLECLISGNSNDNGSQIAQAGGATSGAAGGDTGEKIEKVEAIGKK